MPFISSKGRVVDIPKHLPIEMFCHIIGRIPGEWSQQAVTVTGWALGLQEEPTGLEDDGERPMSHLHWDLSVDDVMKKMVELVEQDGLDEQMLVCGCLACVDYRMYAYLDPKAQEESSASRKRMLEDMRNDLTLPQAERNPPTSDKSLRKFIGMLEEVERTMGDTDEKIKEALEFFRTERDRLFTFEFWRMFESLRSRQRD